MGDIVRFKTLTKHKYSFNAAAEELRRIEEAEAAHREQEKIADKTPPSQKTFKAV